MIAVNYQCHRCYLCLITAAITITIGRLFASYFELLAEEIALLISISIPLPFRRLAQLYGIERMRNIIAHTPHGAPSIRAPLVIVY